MKKLLITTAALAVGALGFASMAGAAQNVANTKHNLSTTAPAGNLVRVTGATDPDEVCVFCHSPHTEAGSDAPLWNRALPVGPYTMYSTATIDMTIAGSPQGVSLACLSCHDGTIGFDQLINAPGSGGYDAAAPSRAYTWNLTITNMAGVSAAGIPPNLGTDLRGSHPISVTYDPVADPQFNPAASVIAAGVPLYGAGANQVECGSCHNPHEADLATFYRISNAGSAMCTTCHIK